MTETSPTSQPEKPRKTWRRRIIRILAAMMIVILALRLLFAILLPAAINRVAGLYDLNATYERSELNLMSGDAGLWHLKFTPKTGGEPVAEVGYIRGNISLLALLRLRLDVWRAEADGVQLLVERNADGSIPLLEKILKAMPATAPSEPAKTNPNEPLDLSAPIRIDALRLQNVATTLRDHTISPTLETRTRLNLRLSDLGSPTRPTSLDMSLWVDPGLDLIRVEGVGKNTAEVIEADLSFVMRGLTPEALRPYLQPLGLAPTDTVVAARGAMKVRLKRNAAPARSVGGTLEFSDLWLRTPGDRVAEAKSVKVNIDSADLSSAHIGNVSVDGGHLTISRSSNGNLAFAGIELAGASSPTEVRSKSPAPASQPSSGAPFVWGVRELKVTNADALFADKAIGGGAAITAQLDELIAKNIIFDPAKPNSTVEFTATGKVPDVIGNATIKGSATPFAPSKRFEFDVSANDICPKAAQPYLAAWGIESTLKQGSASAKVRGDVSMIGGVVAANLSVRDAIYRDGDVEFANLKSAEILGAHVDDATGAIQVQKVEIVGPTIAAGRDATGRAAAFGLAGPVKPSDSRSFGAAKPPATQPSFGSFSLELPRIQIDQFTWKEIRVTYDDQSMPEVRAAGISDAGVELSNFVIDLNSTAASEKPGVVRAFLKAPGIAENFIVEGESSSAAGAFAADLKLRGDGITARALVPYLKLLGIEPSLNNGKLTADARIQITNGQNATALSLNAANVSWRDGESELLGADQIDVDRVRLTDGALNIAGITTVSPRVSVAREQDGSLRAAGFRITVPASSTERNEAAATALLPLPLPIVIGTIDVKSAELAWDDLVASIPVRVRGTAELSLTDLQIRDGATPAKVRALAKLGELVSSAEASGDVLVTPRTLAAALDIKADGIHWKPLAGYFPPGVTSSLQSGRFQTRLDAGLNLNEAGGVGAKFIVENLTFDDAERSLAKVPSFRVIAPRIDVPGGAIDLQELSSKGVELDAAILADGAAQLLGFELRAPPPEPGKAVDAVVTLPAATTQPGVAELVAESQRRLPLLRVEKIDLNLARLTLHNQMISGGEPLVVRELSLENKNKLEWAGPNLERQPPTEFSFEAAIDPLAQTVRSQLMIAPFAQPAPLKIDLAVDGIHGNALTKLVPQLADLVDGSGLDAGHFATRIDAQLQPERRGNIPNYLRGFTADLTIAGTSLRRTAGGDVLGAVESIRAENVRVEPSAGNVIVKSVEIANTAAAIVRDERGVDVLGILIKVPLGAPSVAASANAPPTTAAGLDPMNESAETVPTTQPIASARAQPGGELRIDKFTMSGLDLRIIDKTVDPPIAMPVNAMDVEVAGLSNKLATEPRTMRFDAVLSGGKLSSAATSQPTDGAKDFFSQIAAGGRIALYPEPKGWVKTSINGVELSAFRGVANALGITLGGGVFDGTIDAKLKSNGLIETRNRLVLTDLKLSEPPGGPISKTFKLGPPLDVVLGAVQDVDGSITLPIDVPIQRGELQMNKIVVSAVGAVSQVLATAVASAPVKVVAGVGGLLGGEKDQQGEPRTMKLEFVAGDAAIAAAELSTIQKLASQLRKDRDIQLTLRHDLTTADASIIAQRANLGAADLRALTSQYRAQRDQLLAKRSALAGGVRGKVATLPPRESNAALDELRQIDRQLAAIESSLDSLLDQLRPGAERQSDRRTKSACLELAEQRLDSVRAILIASGARDAAERVRIVAPQFAPVDAGGVEITLIEKKRK